MMADMIFERSRLEIEGETFLTARLDGRDVIVVTFDPDAAAQPGSGVYGLPHGEDDAAVILLPVPFDATTSYGGGAGAGPDAIRTASAQVDLYGGVETEGHPTGWFLTVAEE